MILVEIADFCVCSCDWWFETCATMGMDSGMDPNCQQQSASMDWLQGQSTGNHGFSHEVWGFTAKIPQNQSSEWIEMNGPTHHHQVDQAWSPWPVQAALGCADPMHTPCMASCQSPRDIIRVDSCVISQLTVWFLCPHGHGQVLIWRNADDLPTLEVQFEWTKWTYYHRFWAGMIKYLNNHWISTSHNS